MQAGQAETGVELRGILFDVAEIVLEEWLADVPIDRRHSLLRLMRQRMVGHS